MDSLFVYICDPQYSRRCCAITGVRKTLKQGNWRTFPNPAIADPGCSVLNPFPFSVRACLYSRSLILLLSDIPFSRARSSHSLSRLNLRWLIYRRYKRHFHCTNPLLPQSPDLLSFRVFGSCASLPISCRVAWPILVP